MTDTATPAAPPAAPGHFTLNIPESWWTLDLDPATRDASIRRHVEEQAQGRDIDQALLDRLSRYARRVAREAHAQGALRAAGLVNFLPDGSSIMATTVAIRVVPPEESTTDLAELLVPAALENEKNPLGRGTDANKVETVQVPELGPVGRVTRIEDVDYGGGSSARMGDAHRHTRTRQPGIPGGLQRHAQSEPGDGVLRSVRRHQRLRQIPALSRFLP
ncbi:hypothetical protein HRW16_30265 [Streptomyces lunaelactis]|uniref:hypothetical protein n=1 Tax=Streptomyces lunaelactis TaxID=1535768 RepID=UPI0015853606|nr:hypothetical protein [Streptomyces lunaelactis]NUK38370.1 hypothetical protein [Streptomyces lunaelactis]NUK45401.1 hypothetical protein [Streptomyces lunaelactis]NUK61475.1 hypothetical protein [Streptomyces lunaelactis]NUK96038.1 hypothetical protein [Streptomyces lunaelactis]NUL33909.1 hypothetical protein [Streptomyces lunaelactis]